MVASGSRVPAGMLEHDVDALARHDLEAGHAAGGELGGKPKQIDRGLHRRDRRPRGLDRLRPRHQPQHRRGDDAERAFRADEQVAQVVAGVVLLQLVEVVQDAAVGQHHLEAERMRARDAVGERRGAAGVGRKIAADGAASLRRQQLRIEPVDVGRGLAGALQGDAGLAGDGVGDRIDLADLVHAVERQHDLAVVRDLSADQAGVAALRHDRGRGLVGDLEQLGNLPGRARPQHHRRVAGPQRAELDQIGRLLVLVGDGVLLADHGDQAGERRGGDGGDGFAHFIHGTGVLPWRGGARKPVVDGFAEALIGHRASRRWWRHPPGRGCGGRKTGWSRLRRDRRPATG